MPNTGNAHSPISSAGSGNFTDGTISPTSSNSENELTQEQPVTAKFAKAVETFQMVLNERNQNKDLLDASFDERDILEGELQSKEQFTPFTPLVPFLLSTRSHCADLEIARMDWLGG